MNNLKSQNIKDPKEVLICILDEYDKFFIQKKEDWGDLIWNLLFMFLFGLYYLSY